MNVSVRKLSRACGLEEFVPVVSFSTSTWSIIAGRAPCLTARRAMRDDFL